jgi:DNA end-binding protein Ku
MAPIPVWSGNLRLSLVLVPARLYPAASTEGSIAFRMIHEPSGKPIKYLKAIETERGFKEVPEEGIIKGYEYTKRQHVLIKPKELDDLKLEAKHTIDMARFVDRDEIDSRYFEKPKKEIELCVSRKLRLSMNRFPQSFTVAQSES